MNCENCCESILVDGKYVPGNGGCPTCLAMNSYVPPTISKAKKFLDSMPIRKISSSNDEDTNYDIRIEDAIRKAIQDTILEFCPDEEF